MSVAEAAHRPARSGRAVKLWLALLALVAAGVALAWVGAGSLRGEVTESGVHFRTIQEGDGPFVGRQDGVLIEYEGRLLDGTVFDSSAGRGPTPMLVTQVFPGFAEALTRMQRGGRYKIRIPSELAYGSAPPPGGPIPPDADLEFDVHVVQIVPNAATMMAAPGGPAGDGAPQSPPPQPSDTQPPEAEPQPQP